MMPTEKGLITITHLGQNKEPAKQDGVGQSVVTNVAIVSDQLVIAGENLDGVTKVRITGPSGFDQTFAIESQSASNLVANGLSNIAFAVGLVFDLILTDAQGAATHQVTFTLQDGAVTASKLDDMGAGVGQVLKYDGMNWGPSDLGALTYAGTWDASSATAPNASPAAGEYYIVSVAGTGIDLSDGSGSRNFAVSDWLVYNNTTSRWDKIDNATNVTSFNGRNGPVTPATNDYTWAQIDKTTSPIGDLSNVNTTGAGVGSVLKFDGTHWVVGTDNTTSAGSVDSTAIADGSIVDADVNASAAIAQSKIANLTTDLAAKLNLSGGTMTGDLTMGSNNIITSGTVDGVDVSALNTTVGNNSAAIAGKQNTITTGTTAQYMRGDLSLATFATDARTATVLNSTAGNETDRAASVAAMKSYVAASGGTGDISDGGNSTGATVVVGTNDAQSLQLETNNSPAMTILNGGHVGIGTTSPQVELDISGTMKMTKNTSEPYSCDSTKDAAIAMTSLYTTCVCRNGTGWVSVNDGTTTCKWDYETIIVNGSGRKWSDNSFAVSCNEYRNPTGAYEYSGLTGNGIYTIDPDGAGGDAEFNAYCDMTTDGGGWTLVAENSASGALIGSFRSSQSSDLNASALNGASTVTYGRWSYSKINLLFQNGQNTMRYEVNNSPVAYYKRLTSPSSYDFATAFFQWTSSNAGTLNTNFAIYSNLSDLQSDSNRWSFCNYEADIAFPRDCGATGSVVSRWFGGTSTNPSGNRVLWIK